MKNPTMSRKISLNWFFFIILSTLIVVVIACIGSFVIVRDYLNFKQSTAQLQEDYIQSQKNLIHNEVNQTINYIKYRSSTTEDRLRKSIKSRVYEACDIAANLYKETTDKKSEAETKQIILDALRPIRFNNGRGYYFATGLDGVEILFADHPELEGKSLLDMQDTKGAYVIKDMIDLVKRDGEGFYQYTWTKPGVTGKDFPKIAYIKYFAPFNGFIGTGEYLDDVVSDIQQEVLDRIKQIRFGDQGYIFVVNYDGTTLMNGVQPELIGKNLWDVKDPNGVKVIQEERKAVEMPDGDYIFYQWEKPPAGKISPKMSYVKGFPQWRWMVGAGVYIDEIESTIAAKELAAGQKVKHDIIILCEFLALILFIVLLLSSLLSRYLKKGFDVFFTFFKKMETAGLPISVEHLPIHEFEELATSANAMLLKRHEAETSLKESEERYRALFDRSLDCVYLHDFEGNFIDANEAALNLLGYNRNEIQSLNFASVLGDEQLAHVIEKTNKFISVGHQKKPLELRVKRKDGQFVYLEISTSIIHKSDMPYAVQGIARDITQRRQIEEQLKISEEKYRELVTNAQDIIYTVNLDAVFTDINEAFLREGGYSREDIINKNFMFMLHPDDADIALDAYEQGKKGEAVEFEMRTKKKDGSFSWYSFVNRPIKNPRGDIIGITGIARNIDERKQFESAILEERERLDAILSAQNTGLSIVNPDMTIAWVNRKILEMFPDSDAVGHYCHLFYENRDTPCENCGTRSTFQTGRIVETERFNAHHHRWFHITSIPIKDAQGNIINVLEGVTDITQRKLAEEERAKLELQLVQSQRLESVGRLAGGVAHDFNNMLSVVIGYSEMVLENLRSSEPMYADVQEILDAAKRSAGLTRQLLAFARKQTLEMRPLDLNTVINNFMKMIRRTLRENISIEYRLAPSLHVINGDIGQIEQVILNLAVNAQDAMPNGGKLIFETSDTYLDEVYASGRPGVIPGHYVLMTVSDTGIGMNTETMDRIFEPFFTTKEMGRGTGLGLATVYGIVKQHGGNIWVYSEPGKGTAFKVYFPHKTASDIAIAENSKQVRPVQGTETILLAEDQNQVRIMAGRILKPLGYTLLEAPDGKTALAMAESHPRRIHLLVTDVIMPDMNGRQLYEQLSTVRADIKVLYTSGYTSDVIGHQGVLDEGVHFIQKPFSVNAFASKVREVLDGN
jgi:two-component system, cell cycle sensor histidine kinase and response regulator CckA